MAKKSIFFTSSLMTKILYKRFREFYQSKKKKKKILFTNVASDGRIERRIQALEDKVGELFFTIKEIGTHPGIYLI